MATNNEAQVQDIETFRELWFLLLSKVLKSSVLKRLQGNKRDIMGKPKNRSAKNIASGTR